MPQKVITDYGEIISIFKICKLYTLKLNIVYDNNKLNGTISNISEYIMTLETDFEIPSSVKSVDISFELNKEPYHFKSEVVKISGKELSILIPSQVEIWIPRKYERSLCYGKVFCNINVIRDISQELRTKIQSMPPRLATIFNELSKDTPQIPLIIKMVNTELKGISNIGELFLHKQGENLPLPVIIISKYKKSLLIEDTQDPKSYYKKYFGDDIIPFTKFMEDLNWNSSKIEEEIKKFIIFFQKNNIKSICYVPIFLFENTVGHIRVASLLDKVSKSLTIRDVFYIRSLGDIVSEALAKYKLFSLAQNSEYPLPVHDISIGGIKVEIEQYLSKFLEAGTKVKLNIKFNNGKSISVKGKVLRIDAQEEKLFLAVEFENLDKSDEVIISDFIKKNKE
ncbi:MAG: PilZ domain-containing protein [Brevinematales bacterium]|nr:PilZ domain-containing protein [Brevinematales bacterium]